MKLFTTGLLSCMLVGMSMSVEAADYITAPMSVSPANNSIIGGLGYIQISWDSVKFQLENDGYGEMNQLDKSLVTVTLDGEEIDWSSLMGASFYAAHMQGSSEMFGQGGGATFDAGYVITFYLGDMAFFWKGNLEIAIAPNVITTADGETNPEIVLNYTLKELTPQNDEVFVPSSGATFEEGEGVISITWLTEGELSLNSSKPIFAVLYDELGEAPVEQINLARYCTITEENVLEISLLTLNPGIYSLTIPEGAVNIGDDYINFESIDYEFTIVGSGESTAVKSINVENGENVIYNLQGQKIQDLNNQMPGIYILNGKKVVVKK